MQWKGVVHGNVVVLDEGGQRPDGVRVTITLDQTEVIRAEAVTPDDPEQRRTWTAQMRATLARAIVCSYCQPRHPTGRPQQWQPPYRVLRREYLEFNRSMPHTSCSSERQ